MNIAGFLAVLLVLFEGGWTATTVSNNDLSKLATQLWNVDYNAAEEGTHYSLDLQGKVNQKNDKAPRKLFSKFDEKAIFGIPSYKTFIRLLDNYTPQTGRKDILTNTEINEVNTFLTTILTTEVMKKTQLFLKSKGYTTTMSAFKRLLYDIWFTPYSREKGVQDTSGFEHVFVGEMKKGEITGLHNWVQFYLLEKSGSLDYKGYVFYRQPQLFKCLFTWKNMWKNSASMFVGTSPEFEMAVYTVCFLTRPNASCTLSIAGSRVTVKTYRVNYIKNKPIVASAYPS